MPPDEHIELAHRNRAAALYPCGFQPFCYVTPTSQRSEPHFTDLLISLHSLRFTRYASGFTSYEPLHTMVNAVVPLTAEKPPTFGWLQLEKKAAAALSKLAMRSPPAMATLMTMVNRMSRSNALVMSQSAISKEIGTSRETVNKAIRMLVDHNFIQTVKVGGTTVYVVNSRVAWQGERGARYAAFAADVIALEAEQDSPIDDQPALLSVPQLREGERVLVGNEPIDPPDQGELPLP